MKEVTISKNDAGQRLDKFLQKAFPQLKKSAMYKAIRSKKIKVNRKRASFDQMLQEGDTLLLFLPPDLLEEKSRSFIDLPDPEIIYEDDELIACNKPAGLLSVKDESGDQDTLNGRILSWMEKSGRYDAAAERSFLPGVAHRLDRNTSGLVLAAKTASSARELARAIRDHDVQKSYLAITRKKPQQGRHVVYLKKEGTLAKVLDDPKPDYQEAVLSVKTIDEKDGRCLSKIDLETGRFHQIRATLAHLGTPLENDRKYGDAKGNGRYALQAYRIALDGEKKVIELPKNKRIHL